MERKKINIYIYGNIRKIFTGTQMHFFRERESEHIAHNIDFVEFTRIDFGLKEESEGKILHKWRDHSGAEHEETDWTQIFLMKD